MTLWLVGMMGSGKTTGGKLAASNLGVPFIDLDEEIAAASGITIAEMWAIRGEAFFRGEESAAIERIAGSEAIVSTGGGSVLDASNRRRMRATGTVVWLRAAPTTIASRIGEASGRPLIDDEDDPVAKVAGLSAERSAAYADAADYEIETSELSVEEVAMRIEELWPS